MWLSPCTRAIVTCAVAALWSGPLEAQSLVPRAGSIPDCGAKSKLLKYAPIDVGDIAAIVPLGNVAPPEHTFPTRHLYFHIERVTSGDFNSPTRSVAVRAPGKLWVTEISSTEKVGTGSVDYSLRFAVCTEFTGYFIHLKSLAPRLSSRLVNTSCSEYATGGATYRNCRVEVEIKLGAGKKLGTAGGAVSANALDLGTIDMRVEALAFANPARWSDNDRHVVCALDYYRKGLRRKLERLLGYIGTVRDDDEPCGGILYDQPGTLAGAWFASGAASGNAEDPHLALIHDNVEPDLGLFSVGTSTSASGLGTGRYLFEPTSAGAVDLDFELATPGTVYCYEVTEDVPSGGGGESVLLATLLDATTLQIERIDASACGAGPWSLSAAASLFER